MFKELKDLLLLNLALGNWTFNYANTSYSVIHSNCTFLSINLKKECNELVIKVYIEKPKLHTVGSSVYCFTSLVSENPLVISDTEYNLNPLYLNTSYTSTSTSSSIKEYKYISINNNSKSVHFHRNVIEHDGIFTRMKEDKELLGYLK